MAYSTVTLTGSYTDVSGAALTGAVVITPTTPVVVDTDGNVIITGSLHIDLDADGSFSVALPATDDPNLVPPEFGYEVKVRANGETSTVVIDLPSVLVTFDMSDATPTTIVPFDPQAETVTGAQAKADAAQAAAIAAAATDATTRANAAQAAAATYTDNAIEAQELTTSLNVAAEVSSAMDEAISTAGMDATAKANAAVATANAYTDAQNIDVDAAIEQAVEDHTPGIELGYAERTSTFTSTSNATITGLSVTITGQGRPVEFEFWCGAAWHSVANTWVTGRILKDGVTVAIGGVTSASTAAGPGITTKWREVVPVGEVHTYTVQAFQAAAGTMSFFGATNARMYLTAVSR